MAQKKAAPITREEILLRITIEDASERVNNQIEKGNQLIVHQIRSEEELEDLKAKYKTWRDFTKELLRQIASTAELADEFSYSGVAIAFLGPPPSLQAEIQDFKEDFRRKLNRLISIHERLPLFPVVITGNPEQLGKPVAEIERIARRFHVVARQLRQRHSDRTTIDIGDEYDVQDLFHSLLKLFFDDVRAEEWTPSYAGGSSRMDFLLKAEKTVVEVKKTRPGLGSRELGSQLIEDIGRYRAHPDCRQLVCFAYDPDGRIANPDGIERDLSRVIDEMTVKVVIAPKGH